MKIVGFIPARGGSKGLANKNVRQLNGKPLMAWSIDAANACPLIDDVYVSSDNPVYLETALKFGALPLERPSSLAQDTTSIKDVLMDAVENINADAIALLYPVYPLRTGKDMTMYIEEFVSLGGNRSMTGAVPPKTHPYLCYREIEGSNPQHIFEPYIDQALKYRRQDYPEYWEITLWPAIFPTKILHSLNHQLINWESHFYKLPDPLKGSDIDTQEQFEFVEYLMKTKYKDEF